MYATLEGVGSARALAWLCANHNAFRWLVGGVSVNHHTLSDFRVAHVDWLDQVLTHSVAVLREQELVDLNRVAHDGMRSPGQRRGGLFRRKPTLEEHLAEAEEQVRRLKEELDDDPGTPSRRQAKARERAARERTRRLRRALARIPEMEAKKKPDEKHKARASSTDPEATVMKMPDGGFRPAFNIQYTADCPSQVIVAVEVTTSGSDMGQLKPQIQEIHERFGVYPEEALADGGFAKHEDIEQIERGCGGCKVYAPAPAPEDPKADRYAPHPKDSEEVIRWRADGQRRGQGDLQGTRSTAECVNAQAQNRGLVQLFVRGRRKVKAVALWFAIAHNVVRGLRLRSRGGDAHGGGAGGLREGKPGSGWSIRRSEGGKGTSAPPAPAGHGPKPSTSTPSSLQPAKSLLDCLIHRL